MAKKEEKKISIFGEAKVKSSGSKPKDDKEVVYIDGLESKLLELQFLKAQIADLEAQLVGVTDEIKTISKEKFVELYQTNKSNPNTFLIKDGEGCVMVIPTDRYISIKDEDRANQLMEEYGDDVITIDEKYYFNPQVLERNMSAIEKIIMDAKTISDDDKRNLLVKEVKYSISKGYIDKLAVYGNKIETVIDDIQPIITLKNCGGKMEEGGELDSDFIATIYENGGGVEKYELVENKDGSYSVLNKETNMFVDRDFSSKQSAEYFIKRERVIDYYLNNEDLESFVEKFNDLGLEEIDEFEKGGFLGGIFGGGRTYKKGLAYKLDRAKHNKSEDWEVPLKNRKRYANGGGVGDKKPKFKIGDEVVALPSKFRFVKKIVGSYDGGEHFGTMYSLESSPNTYYTENQLEFPNEENTKYQERGRSLEYYQGVPIYAKGGGVEDYYGSMTDESVVMQNCSNGEIHCDILEEIIGSKPEYPYQEVGSIRLQKCYLRPYYKICK